MPLPLLVWAGAAIGAAVLVGVFWNKIRAWLENAVVVFIGVRFGPDYAQAFRDLLAATDGVITNARQMVKQAFLKAQSALIRGDDGRIYKQGEQYLRNPLNPRGATKRITTEEVSLDDLPSDVKAKLAADGAFPGEILLIT